MTLDPGTDDGRDFSNPMYDIRTTLQITSDLVYQVFAPYGTIEKIVVIQKSTNENGQQALVQFNTAQSADQAKQYLQGQNVYVGTSVYFTLDLQYSHLQDVTVRSNSPTARIYSGAGATPGAAPAVAPAAVPAPAGGQLQQQQMMPQGQTQGMDQQQLLQQQMLMQQQLMQQMMQQGQFTPQQLQQMQMQMQQPQQMQQMQPQQMQQMPQQVPKPPQAATPPYHPHHPTHIPPTLHPSSFILHPSSFVVLEPRCVDLIVYVTGVLRPVMAWTELWSRVMWMTRDGAKSSSRGPKGCVWAILTARLHQKWGVAG